MLTGPEAEGVRSRVREDTVTIAGAWRIGTLMGHSCSDGLSVWLSVRTAKKMPWDFEKPPLFDSFHLLQPIPAVVGASPTLLGPSLLDSSIYQTPLQQCLHDLRWCLSGIWRIVSRKAVFCSTGRGRRVG